MKNKYFEFNLNDKLQNKIDKFLQKPPKNFKSDKQKSDIEIFKSEFLSLKFELRRTKFYMGIGFILFFVLERLL